MKVLTLGRRRRKLEQVDHVRLVHACTAQTHAPIIPLDRNEATRELLAYRAGRQRELSDRSRAFTTLEGSIDPSAFCLTRGTAFLILRPPRFGRRRSHEVRVCPPVMQCGRSTSIVGPHAYAHWSGRTRHHPHATEVLLA